MTKWDVGLSKVLKARRAKLGLTLAEVAGRMQVETNCVWRWEAGKNRMFAGTLVDLAEALETTAGELMDEVKE